MGLIAMFGRSASKKEHTQHERSPFRPPLLSPHSGGLRSPSNPNFLSAPSPILTPPSPTLSPSTTDLCGRNPGDGTSGLQAVQQHDHTIPASTATAFTAGPSMDKAPIGKGDASDPPSTVAHINPLDDNTDPTPFAFKPYAKTLKDLDTMGDLEGLCAGVGTNRTNGLSVHSLGQGAGDGEKPGGEGAFAAALSDRQRLYGTNSLPTRPSKSLAIKDKVLVC